MNKLLIALIASAFSATVAAQGAMQTPEDKAKQKEVEAATKGKTGGSATTAGSAAAKDKATTPAPKAPMTKEEKQKEVAAATKGTTGAAATTAGSAAAKDKAMKPAPKAPLTEKEKQAEVDAATKAKAGK